MEEPGEPLTREYTALELRRDPCAEPGAAELSAGLTGVQEPGSQVPVTALLLSQ